MAKQLTRDELAWLIEELDRGDARQDEVEELVAKLELTISDAEALEILEDDELTSEEIADELVGYTDLDA